MARADKPMIVPVHQGTARITILARSYAGTVELTSDANDFCQNAVSITTRARLPNLRTRPKRIAVNLVSECLYHYINPALRWTKHTSARLGRQQTSSIVPFDVHLSRHDFVVQAVHSPDMFVREYRQRKVDQQDQSNSRMQEVRQKRSL